MPRKYADDLSFIHLVLFVVIKIIVTFLIERIYVLRMQINEI